MNNVIQGLKIGGRYKLKLTFKSRAISVTFEGYPVGATIDDVSMRFRQERGGNNLFLLCEHIEHIDQLPDVQTKKAAKSKQCSRCNGKGVLEWLTHIEGGRCFNCDGAGRV